MVYDGNMTPPKREENCQFCSIQDFKNDSTTIGCASQCQYISDTDVLPYDHIHQYSPVILIESVSDQGIVLQSTINSRCNNSGPSLLE